MTELEDMKLLANILRNMNDLFDCYGFLCNDCPFNNYGSNRNQIGGTCGKNLIKDYAEKVLNNVGTKPKM